MYPSVSLPLLLYLLHTKATHRSLDATTVLKDVQPFLQTTHGQLYPQKAVSYICNCGKNMTNLDGNISCIKHQPKKHMCKYPPSPTPPGEAYLCNCDQNKEIYMMNLQAYLCNCDQNKELYNKLTSLSYIKAYIWLVNDSHPSTITTQGCSVVLPEECCMPPSLPQITS